MGSVPDGAQAASRHRRLKSDARTGKPSLLAVARLRCPLCGKTPLQDHSWFQFKAGCVECDYRFEREPGYFWAAAWVFTYTASSLAGLGVAAGLYRLWPHWDILLIAALAALTILPLSLFLFPYSRALWMWMDFYFHPLEPDERLVTEE